MTNGAFRFRLLGQILMEKGLIRKQDLDEALEQQKNSGLPLGRILLTLGLITEEDLFNALGVQAQMEKVDLEKMNIPQEVRDKVPGSVAKLYHIMPLSLEGNTLTIATSDPLNFSILDDLRFMLNCTIKAKVASATSISHSIQMYYGTEAENVEEIFSEISQKIPELLEEGESIENIEAAAAQLPIVKLINIILIQAIRKKASDIHFEPFQDDFKIRYRIDGILHDLFNPPKNLHLPLASRVKVMANLNIAETRLPQDGRIFVKMNERMVDLRISTLPTIFGESIVIRVLDKAAVPLSPDELGFGGETKEKLLTVIKKPYGIILSTGPTGCGKTTTQYSCLTSINKVESKIITVEDPVEFEIPGLIQVSVRPKINLTFPMALRHILRQDPDIIMVGEIRDIETVQMAIHASLTGHLVFSTLHTNDAPSAITRIIDMGVEPFLIASAVEAVLAQRLVRRLCQKCKKEYFPDEAELKTLGLVLEKAPGRVCFQPVGCADCDDSGYHGRIGIFELLVLDEDLRSLILDRAPVGELRRQAVKNGMRTLREDGQLKIFAGLTTIEEIVSVTSGAE